MVFVSNLFLLVSSNFLSLMLTPINLVAPPTNNPPFHSLFFSFFQCFAISGNRITPTPLLAPWRGCFSGPWWIKSCFLGRIFWKSLSRCISVKMKASMLPPPPRILLRIWGFLHCKALSHFCSICRSFFCWCSRTVFDPSNRADGGWVVPCVVASWNVGGWVL